MSEDAAESAAYGHLALVTEAAELAPVVTRFLGTDAGRQIRVNPS